MSLISVARRLVADLMPPVIHRAGLRAWRRFRGMGSSTFDGHYPTLSAAPAADDSYDDPALVREIVANRMVHLRTLRLSPDLPLPTVDETGRTILPLLAGLHLAESERLAILDFGGGLGVSLNHVLNGLTGDAAALIKAGRLQFHIVETPSMAAAVRPALEQELTRIFGSASFVQVHDRVPQVPVDIVNVASTIQYIDDYRGMLATLAGLKPMYLVISETPMRPGPEYARTQHNMPRRTLKTWVFDYAALIGVLAGLGYEPVFRVVHDQPNVTHANPAPGAPANMTSIVFRRR